METASVMRQQLSVVAPQLVRAQQQLGKIDQPATRANFFVRLIKRDHLAAIRIAIVVEVLRSQAFVFLAVNKILNVARHPATIVDLEVFEQALDQAQLIVRVDDLKILRQARFAPMPSQQPVCEAVKSAYPQVIDGRAEQALNATAHLSSGFVGKRNGEQALWRYTLDIDEPGSAVYQHAGFATAGPCDDERRLGRRRNSLTLRVIEGFEYGCNVHRQSLVGAGKGAILSDLVVVVGAALPEGPHREPRPLRWWWS